VWVFHQRFFLDPLRWCTSVVVIRKNGWKHEISLD
jgi:hypothetical protein